MITEKDLKEAIAECQGVKNPNADTCIKLAAFYTIYDHLYPSKQEEIPQYSYQAPPVNDIEKVIDYYSDTEFGQAIDGRDAFEIWEIMDDLMSALQMLNPALYANAMRKLES